MSGELPMYEVKFFDGDYRQRQEAANKWGADLYFEQHFNALAYDDPDTQKDNPILTIVANNASGTSILWANNYSSLVNSTFPQLHMIKAYGNGINLDGVVKRKYKERGDFNLRFTDMPAILGEPLFLSDPMSAKLAMDHKMQYDLARCLVDSIVRVLPQGGKIALSIGHMGKTSSPFDRGAPITDKVDNPNKWAEAHIAKMVLDIAAEMLRDSFANVTGVNVVTGVKIPATDAPPVICAPEDATCPHCGKGVRLTC